ncbi:MAG TPA: hypothetical protein VGL91_12980 [Acidobacteriota bacterium]
MRHKPINLITALLTVGAIAIWSSSVNGQSVRGPLRIGTYDSRAIAVAYARSGEYQNYVRGLKAELEKAKAAKDERRVKELETWGPVTQARLHEQGFSTGSVKNIMDRIKDSVPGIAREASVSMILSKWEVVYGDPSVEYVDVTLPLVKLFNPDERTLRIVEEVSKHEPIPLEKLEPELKK